MESKLTMDWTKHESDPEKKENLENAILNSTTALRRLLELIEEDEQELLQNPISNYNVPNWAYLQADRAGQIRQINKIKSRLSFLKA